MRLARFQTLVLAASAASLPAAVSAQTTRIPPQVQNLKNSPGLAADPSASDSPSISTIPAAGERARNNSQSIGDNSKDPAVRRLEETSAGLIPPGGVIGIESGDEGRGSDRDSVVPASQGGPDAHVVQKGDTLWSICSKYFADPWRWPRLWAANPSITNPHWIFPGDVVRLGPSAGDAASPVAGADKPKDVSRQHMTDRLTSLSSNAVVLREVGFIEAKDLAQAATLSGSREEKELLSSGDQAYLSFPKDRPIRAGERYSIFETDVDNPVKDPETGKVYGYLVRVRGDVVIDQIAGEDMARGTITDVIDIVERGARVSSAIRQFRRVEPRPSEVNLEGRIVAAFSPARFLSAEKFVVLNRGRRDGVQVGNRNFIIRRGDGYRAVLEGWEKTDHKYPKEVVGEIWIVDVRDNASVAWIARSSKELLVGEVTEMRKGY
ncbi:MAG TPA: LysM domain-containing protein [Polyangia bacterium]